MDADDAAIIYASMARDAPAVSPTFQRSWLSLMAEIKELADPKFPRTPELVKHLRDSVDSLSQWIGRPALPAATYENESADEGYMQHPERATSVDEAYTQYPEPDVAMRGGGESSYAMQALLAAVVLSCSIFSSIVIV